MGHPGKLLSCWKLLGKLPEVQRVAQVGAMMAVRLCFAMAVIVAKLLPDAESGKMGLQQCIG